MNYKYEDPHNNRDRQKHQQTNQERQYYDQQE